MEGKNAHPLPGKVRAVIFDMDGLLIDTEKYLVPCWCQAAREMGFPMKRRHALHIRSLAGKFAEAYLQSELGADFDYFKVRERRKELVAEKIRTEGLQPKKGAAELLRWLGERASRQPSPPPPTSSGRKGISGRWGFPPTSGGF